MCKHSGVVKLTVHRNVLSAFYIPWVFHLHSRGEKKASKRQAAGIKNRDVLFQRVVLVGCCRRRLVDYAARM